MRHLVEIFWIDGDEGHVAVVPDLPGCSAWGATPEVAAREVQDAVAAWGEGGRASGEPVSAPATRARPAAWGTRIAAALPTG